MYIDGSVGERRDEIEAIGIGSVGFERRTASRNGTQVGSTDFEASRENLSLAEFSILDAFRLVIRFLADRTAYRTTKVRKNERDALNGPPLREQPVAIRSSFGACRPRNELTICLQRGNTMRQGTQHSREP